MRVLVAGCGTAGSVGPGKQKNLGRLVVERLLLGGEHDVVVLVRKEAAAEELRRMVAPFAAARHRLRVLVGDCMELAFCMDAMGSGIDIVMCSIGGTDAEGHRTDGVAGINLIDAAVATRYPVRRFLLMTSLGCGETWEHLNPQAQKFLHDALKAKDLAEERLQASGLRYTILRPGGLHAGTDPSTGRGLLLWHQPMVGGSINRIDLAELTVHCLFMEGATGDLVLSALDRDKVPGDALEAVPPADIFFAQSGPALVMPSAADPSAATWHGRDDNGRAESVERPPFDIVLEADGYQVRRYAKMVMAETMTKVRTGRSRQPDDNSFIRLAGFIGVGGTPQNAHRTSGQPVPISMTSPVFTRRDPADSANPSLADGAIDVDSPTMMSFVLPSSRFTSAVDAPMPTDGSVVLREIDSTTFAVITFSGYALEADMEAQRRRLLEFLARDGAFQPLAPADRHSSAWMQARYDPPWTPDEKRTNEVFIAVEAVAAVSTCAATAAKM